MKNTISNLTTGVTTQTEMTDEEIAALETEHEESRQEFLRRYGPEYKLRQERDRLLNETDWTQVPDSALTDEKKNEWAEYRQALRDLPANTSDPANPTWPDEPE